MAVACGGCIHVYMCCDWYNVWLQEVIFTLINIDNYSLEQKTTLYFVAKMISIEFQKLTHLLRINSTGLGWMMSDYK